MNSWPGFVRADGVNAMQRTDKQRKGIIITITLAILFVLIVFAATFFNSM
jgi:hypothetical protein